MQRQQHLYEQLRLNTVNMSIVLTLEEMKKENAEEEEEETALHKLHSI